jgi:hypothetical protein
LPVHAILDLANRHALIFRSPLSAHHASMHRHEPAIDVRGRRAGVPAHLFEVDLARRRCFFDIRLSADLAKRT